jgi:hypothetical protein
MKTFGWIYIVAYCIDALGSLVAILTPRMEGVSNIISTLVALLSIVVLILAYMGKLKPRKIFLIMSGFYMAMLGVGIVIAVLLAAKLGPSVASQEITLAFLREQFAWYNPVQWIIIIIWLLVSAYGIQAYRKVEWPTEQEATGDAQTRA